MVIVLLLELTLLLQTADSKMKISELKAGQGKVDIEVKVKEKKEPRTIEKYGKELKLCNTIVTDDSGDISMTLWNDDVDKVNQGDTLKITNGYVSEFNGQKQLSSGKYGKLEVAGSGHAKNESVAGKETIKKEGKKKKEEAEEIPEESSEESGDEEYEDVEF